MNPLNPKLIEASKGGHLDIVKYLIQEGADINHANNNGNTALITATIYGHLEIVKDLIHEGANVNHTNNYGETALIKASRSGHLDIVKELIKEGADVNHANNNGNTSLMTASLYDQLDVVKYLIQEGADINHTNNYGLTALMTANRDEKLDTVKFLIQVGADYTSLKNNPRVNPIIDDIIKEYSNDLKTELTNNYLVLSKAGPQFNTGDKIKSAIQKELLLKTVYEVPYQQLCSNINRDYPPLKLISLANILKIDYNLDISWLDLCDKVNKTPYILCYIIYLSR